MEPHKSCAHLFNQLGVFTQKVFPRYVLILTINLLLCTHILLLPSWQRRLFLVVVVCLFICLLATFLKMLGTDCNEYLSRGLGGERNVGGDPDHHADCPIGYPAITNDEQILIKCSE